MLRGQSRARDNVAGIHFFDKTADCSLFSFIQSRVEYMGTHFLFASKEFSPTAGELDEEHDDYINPGAYALELADFLEKELSLRGYGAKFRCQEDWGHWMELEHQGNFALAVCCSNTGEEMDGQAEHRVFLSPEKPFIRKLFKKIDISSDLERITKMIQDILESNPDIHNIRMESMS